MTGKPPSRDPHIWWERWGGRYRPVSWKAWAAIGVFCLMILPLAMAIGFVIADHSGLPHGRELAFVFMMLVIAGFFVFIERHTPPRNARGRGQSKRRK